MIFCAAALLAAAVAAAVFLFAARVDVAEDVELTAVVAIEGELS
jgi:hypothetical protein